MQLIIFNGGKEENGGKMEKKEEVEQMMKRRRRGCYWVSHYINGRHYLIFFSFREPSRYFTCVV